MQAYFGFAFLWRLRAFYGPPNQSMSEDSTMETFYLGLYPLICRYRERHSFSRLWKR